MLMRNSSANMDHNPRKLSLNFTRKEVHYRLSVRSVRAGSAMPRKDVVNLHYPTWVRLNQASSCLALSWECSMARKPKCALWCLATTRNLKLSGLISSSHLKKTKWKKSILCLRLMNCMNFSKLKRLTSWLKNLTMSKNRLKVLKKRARTAVSSSNLRN